MQRGKCNTQPISDTQNVVKVLNNRPPTATVVDLDSIALQYSLITVFGIADYLKTLKAIVFWPLKNSFLRLFLLLSSSNALN